MVDAEDNIPVLNIPLIRKTMEYIESTPQNWDQNFYYMEVHDGEDNICRTTMCFAGTACFLAGYDQMDVCDSSVYIPETERWEPIFDVAQRLLGLTESQAWNIFEAANCITKTTVMRHWVEDTIGEKL